MSWIFGILRKNKQTVIPRKEYHPFKSKDKFSVETKDYYFASGTGHKNSFYKYDQKKNSGWMVCGTGISFEKDTFRLMDFHDWEAFLSKKNNNIRDLNGHFIIVEWERGEVRIRNDQLGMRDMYFAENDNYFSFSTRLDWLIPFANNPEIDFKVYGSIWLYINSFCYNCFVRNIERLGQGGKAKIINNKLYISTSPWLPQYAKAIDKKDARDLIYRFCTIGIKQQKDLILGLSGGLDSRVLLSILLKFNYEKWMAYTYGDNEFPDAIIANKTANKLGFSHKFITVSIPREEELSKYEDFVLETNGFVNGYFFYEQEHYNRIQKNHLLIDGGKGAFCRRNHAKHLWLKGRNHILDGNSEEVLKNITLNKPRIFKKDIINIMKNESIKEMDYIIRSMPKLTEVGAGNWVDIFTVRYHCANAGSPLQTRLDSIICNYMPFLQPSFLRKLFELPVSYRAWNKVYKSILHKGNSSLRQIPLVKDMSIIPFTTNTYLTFILGKLQERFQKFQTADYAQIFLTNNREFVLDTLHNRAVLEYPYYDYNIIQKLVEGYYKGEKGNAKSVLWWLTFDVWRRFLKEGRSKKLD